MKETINTILRKVGLKAVEVKLEQMKLADGVTTIEAELFEAGQPVFVVTEEATIALPIGEYELEDGRILVCEEEGVIASINEKEAEVEEEAPVAEASPEAEMAAPQQPTAKKVIESIVKETQFSQVDEVAELKARIAELELAAQVDEAPAAEAIQFNPENETNVEVFRYTKKRSMSTIDSVLNKLYK